MRRASAARAPSMVAPSARARKGLRRRGPLPVERRGTQIGAVERGEHRQWSTDDGRRRMSEIPVEKRADGALAELRRQLGTVPNQLTAARLALVPVLWAVALLGEPVWLGVGVIVASVTDMLDGWLSRRWNQTSEFGARLDS